MVACALTACGPKQDHAPSTVGTHLALSLPALDGGTIDTARYRGKIVVLHVFTTWSMNSQAEVEQFVAVHQQYPDQIVVIGVGMDIDGYVLVSPWRKANAIPYLIGLATDAIRRGGSALGKISQVPTTVVIDRRGLVTHRLDRPLAPGELDELVRGLATGK